MYQTTEKQKSTSMSYTQFKVFNRMHVIFADFDFRLIFWGYFLTSISSLALFLLLIITLSEQINFDIYLKFNLNQQTSVQSSALGNNHRVCGIYSPELRAEVYCVRLNFSGLFVFMEWLQLSNQAFSLKQVPRYTLRLKLIINEQECFLHCFQRKTALT